MKEGPLKVAMIIPDDRDEHRRPDLPEPWFGPAPNTLRLGLAECPDVELHILSCERQLLPASRQLSENTYFHPVPVSRWAYMRTCYLGSIRALRRTVAQIRPDVVHGQGTERYAGLGAAYSRRPNVITILGNMRAVARQRRARFLSFHWITARLETVALRRTDGVLCNSEYTRSEVKSVARRTWSVPNGLSPEFFGPRTVARTGVPRIVNLGHIHPYKGQVELLQHMQQLHAGGQRFQLEFIGGTDAQTAYGQNFLRLVEQASHEGWARHLGALPREEVIRHLDGASAAVHVSREESFGLAVAEALAREVKMFAFTAGGVADIVAGVSSVEAFAPNAWEDLVRALGAWLKAGAPATATTAKIMQARYSPRAIAARHVEVYRELLEAARR